ncbi:hypothetical protein [Streptomyces sp. NPDC059168]|uniref:hypothetical protein n=1 Tax=Streptomyces sp. NPDC059168 TaxID=3346753 RepID=UPI0036846829
MRPREPMGALLVAGHLVAYSLLGLIIHHDLTAPQTAAAAPDIPLTQPDPEPDTA